MDGHTFVLPFAYTWSESADSPTEDPDYDPDNVQSSYDSVLSWGDDGEGDGDGEAAGDDHLDPNFT